jgi:hypothetical protein
VLVVSVHQFLVPQTQRDIYRKIIHATASAEVHVTSNEQLQTPASVLSAIKYIFRMEKNKRKKQKLLKEEPKT